MVLNGSIQVKAGECFDSSCCWERVDSERRRIVGWWGNHTLSEGAYQYNLEDDYKKYTNRRGIGNLYFSIFMDFIRLLEGKGNPGRLH